ncbi:MAG: PhoH family protein [Patescibacteria group bacterium]
MANKRNAHVNARPRAKSSVKSTEPIEEKEGNVIMFDTNVIINDQDCISEFLKQSGNVVVVPRMVILELDKLKNPKSEIKSEARMATKIIYDFRKTKSNRVFISWKQNFKSLDLDRNVPDYNIIAAFNYALTDKKFIGYKKFKLITDDTAMLLIASELFAGNSKVEVSPYNHIRVKVKKEPKKLKTIILKESDYEVVGSTIKADRFKRIKENGAVLVKYDNTPEFMAIRKGKYLVPADVNTSVCAIKSMPHPKLGINWKQAQFISHLIDPAITMVFVSGIAGTGKTLLALAAALHQRGKYGQIILTRPAVPLDNEDNLGFLPGDLNAKMAEYIVPFVQDLEVIIEANDKNPSFFMRKNKAYTTNLLLAELRKDPFAFLSNLNIKVNAVQHYRGRTYHNSFIIVDEAQNLTHSQVKAILTRAGKNCKIVLTGDLEQIDKKFLNSENSGLANAIVKLGGQPLVGVTMLHQTVRSETAELAEKLL